VPRLYSCQLISLYRIGDHLSGIGSETIRLSVSIGLGQPPDTESKPFLLNMIFMFPINTMTPSPSKNLLDLFSSKPNSTTFRPTHLLSLPDSFGQSRNNAFINTLIFLGFFLDHPDKQPESQIDNRPFCS
jgi:hypothetical protein